MLLVIFIFIIILVLLEYQLLQTLRQGQVTYIIQDLNVQDLDVDGHTNLDNVSIAGVTTTTDHIYIDADNKN